MKHLGAALIQARHALAAAALASIGHAALAQETIKLTLASGFPTVQPFIAEVQATLIPTVNEELKKTNKYKIDWTEAHAGSLVRAPAMLQAATDGVVDIAVMGQVFEPAKLPLQNVGSALPFGAQSIKVATLALHEMHKDVPALNQSWNKLGVTYLTSWANGNYYLMSKTPIKSVDDLKGKKVGTGAALFGWLKGTGAVGVASSFAATYNDMSSGVFDIVVTPLAGAAAAKFYEVAPYVTKVDLGAVNTGSIIANKARWDTLPDEVKKAIQTGADKWQQAYFARMEKLDTAAVETMKKGGATFYTFSKEERAKWAKLLPPLGKEWVARMDALKLPGRQVIDYYMNYLRKHSDDVVRDWDKE